MERCYNIRKEEKVAQTKSTEENLWKACDKLRGSVEPAEYKHVVLSLVFLKYVSDTYEKQREKLKLLEEISTNSF